MYVFIYFCLFKCREAGDVSCFEEMLNNIFAPLFAVTLNPSSNPPLHYFLGNELFSCYCIIFDYLFILTYLLSFMSYNLLTFHFLSKLPELDIFTFLISQISILLSLTLYSQVSTSLNSSCDISMNYSPYLISLTTTIIIFSLTFYFMFKKKFSVMHSDSKAAVSFASLYFLIYFNFYPHLFLLLSFSSLFLFITSLFISLILSPAASLLSHLSFPSSLSLLLSPFSSLLSPFSSFL